MSQKKLRRGARLGRRVGVGVTALIVSLASAGPAMAGSFSMPKFSPSQPPNTDSVATVMGWLQWGGLALCVAGIMIAGATMAVAHRNGRGGEHGAAVGWVIGGAVLIGAASSLIGAVAG